MFQHGLRTVRFMETMLPKCRMSFLYCCNSTVSNEESPRAIICVRLFGEVWIPGWPYQKQHFNLLPTLLRRR
jgi:hypothetical protein